MCIAKIIEERNAESNINKMEPYFYAESMCSGRPDVDYFLPNWRKVTGTRLKIQHETMLENSKKIYGLYPWIGYGHVEKMASARFWKFERKGPRQMSYGIDGELVFLDQQKLWN